MSAVLRVPPDRFTTVAWSAGQAYAPPVAAGLDAVAPRRDAWLVLAPGDAWAHPEVSGLIAVAATARPDVELFYADVAWLRAGERPVLQLTPSFDRTQLMARDYLGPTLAVRGSAFHALGGLRGDAGAARVYDLALRAVAAGFRVDRIAEVLTALPADRAITPTEDRRRVLQAALTASGEPLDLIPGRAPGSFGLARRFETPPPVTLVVPTLESLGPDGRPHLAALLDGVARTDWPMDRMTVLVGDDCASDALYRAGAWPFRLQRVETGRPVGQPFNYAAKMNHLWRLAQTEHLVLLNDDVEVPDPSWLRALMTFAVSQDVGAVGARLLFPDGRLQHAGVIGGLFGLCAHPWFGQPAERATYQDWALIQREWSIVTGAVLATRRSVLERVNGFDPAFSLDFNDVDLCLKMRMQGLRVVYTPYAELIHHEKASRGDHPTLAAEMAIFLRRWRELLDDDPSYHPAMSRNSYEPAPVQGAGAWYEGLASQG